MTLPNLTSEQKQAYFDRMRPYATNASVRLSIPVSVILGQWALETYYGASDVAIRANNHGGIKHVATSIDSGAYGVYAKYASISQFVDDYVRVMSLSYYSDVREAPDTDIEGTVLRLGQSPYAGSHYEIDGRPGASVLGVIQANRLTRYDSATPVAEIDLEKPGEMAKYAAIGAALMALLAMTQ